MSLAGWKIKGIYCGGDHSWVTIDEGEPYIPKEDYETPSPLKSLDNLSDSFGNDNNVLGIKNINQQNNLLKP